MPATGATPSSSSRPNPIQIRSASRARSTCRSTPYVHSSAGNLANFALLDEQIVSVGASTDLVGGAQIEPLFFRLDHSEIVFRLEPVLDFRQAQTLADFDHNRVEVPINLSIEDLYLRSTYEGEIYGEVFLREHDPVFRYVVGGDSSVGA